MTSTEQERPTPPQPKQQQKPPGTEGELSPKADHGEASYKGSGKLTGKVALITGGDSGIGKAVAIAFAREGADLIISYLNEDKDAEDTARLVREAGRKAVLVSGDIGDESLCRSLVQRAVDELGQLDIVVNNAAFQMSHDTLEEITSEELEHTFRTNVYAMFWICQAALPHLKPGASIINTSSVNDDTPNPTLLPYAATKAAIANFSQGLAQLVAERGIRVNAVAPGPVWTPLIPSTMPEEKVEKFGKSYPIGRPAQPAELAPLYVLLASNDGSYISGATIPVTGGKPMG